MNKHGELWFERIGDSYCEHKVYWENVDQGWYFQHGNDESILWLPNDEWQPHEPETGKVPQWKQQVKAWVRYLHADDA